MSSRISAQPGTHDPIHHDYGKQHCLKVLQKLSAYLDEELTGDICAEIRSHLGACPNCEVFLDSLRQTIALCRHHQPHLLSAADRATIRRHILKSVPPA
ncbi:MAG: anti-sigma factor [Nitrospiraceae bacterium]